ncbi:MAG: hypothetical protein Aureis2KO_30860 [Aureisphaera sp.]
MKKLLILCVPFLLLSTSCSKDDDSGSSGDGNSSSLVFEDTTISIDENPAAGTLLVTLAAESIDVITYSLEGGNADAITLNPVSGEVTVQVTNYFDFEENPVVTFDFKATARRRVRNATLTIQLNNVESEGPYFGSVILPSQERVDAFGANNYTSVSEYLHIGGEVPQGETPITSLLPLRTIASVEDALRITEVEVLASLNGLQALQQAGSLRIEDAPELTNLNGLQGLQGVGSVHTSRLDKLTTLDGIENLARVEHSFNINDNGQLLDIAALSNTIIDGNLSIQKNFALPDFNGLENVSVGGILTLAENKALTSIQGFENNTSLGGLRILLHPLLHSFGGLKFIESIEGDFIIDNNYALEHLSFIPHLDYVGQNFTIKDNENLISVSFPTLTSVDNNLSILRNTKLTQVNGMGSLTHVGRNFFITDNTELTNFCPFTNLIMNEGIQEGYEVDGNGYNPTEADIIAGDCSN